MTSRRNAYAHVDPAMGVELMSGIHKTQNELADSLLYLFNELKALLFTINVAYGYRFRQFKALLSSFP